MGGRGSGGTGTRLATHTVAVRAEKASRQAYARAARFPGDWVPLTALRDAITGTDREHVDTALRSLAVKPGVTLIPWDNRKALTSADRAASLRFGGDDNNAIRIER